MGASSSSSSSDSSNRPRILEVKIKSANLNIINHNNNYREGPLFYVKLWIDKDMKLQTARVSCTNNGIAIWEQRFVFVVPHHTLLTGGNERPSVPVSFEILRAHKVLPGSSMGKAHANLELFEEESNSRPKRTWSFDSSSDFELMEMEENNNNNNSKSESESEAVSPKMMKGSGRLRVGKAELSVEVVMWRPGCISSVGSCKWRRSAMDYDEFMMSFFKEDNKEEVAPKKNKHQLFTCFANSSSST